MAKRTVGLFEKLLLKIRIIDKIMMNPKFNLLLAVSVLAIRGSAMMPSKNVIQDTALARKYYNEGIKLYHNGDTINALFYLTKAIKADSTNSHYYYVRSEMYEFSGNYILALVDINKVIQFNSLEGPQYKTRGDIESQIGNYEAALQDYTTAVRKSPNSFKYRYAKIRCLDRLKRFEEALDETKTALNIFPDDIRLFFRMGKYNYLLNNFNEAKFYLIKYENLKLESRLQSETDGIHYMLGLIYFTLNQYDSAISYLELSMRTYSTLEANNKLAVLYSMKNDSFNSRRRFMIWKENAPNDPYYYLRYGIAECKFKNYKKGIDQFNIYLSLVNPDAVIPDIYRNIGIAKGYLGDVEGAMANFNKTILLDSMNQVAYYNRLEFRPFSIDKVSEIINDLTKLVELFSDRQQLPDFYAYRGNLKLYLKDTLGCEADMMKAIQLAPKNPVFHYNLAAYYFFYRSPLPEIQKEIRNQLEATIKLQSGQIFEAHKLLCLEFLLEGNTDEAAIVYLKIMEIAKTSEINKSEMKGLRSIKKQIKNRKHTSDPVIIKNIDLPPFIVNNNALISELVIKKGLGNIPAFLNPIFSSSAN